MPLRAASSDSVGIGRKLAAAAFLLAYYIYFSWDRLRVHFSPDDLMNMAFYWKRGGAWMVYAQFPLWHGYYRPMGAVFYLPLFQAFGLNPVPFQFTAMILILAGAFLLYRFARQLGCGELAAGLAALIACYHAGLSALYYYTGFIYDALCFLFYVGALVFYTGIRARGRQLSGREIAAFLALFLCALNSKEIAVTLPVVLLVYEWIYHRPTGHALSWLGGPGRVALCSAAMSLLSIYGKLFGPDPLINASGYRPVFSLDQLQRFQTAALSDLLLNRHYEGWARILLQWAILFCLAWICKRPVLRFCLWFVLITELPVEFLDNRTGANLYIPLAGMAIFGADLLTHALWRGRDNVSAPGVDTSVDAARKSARATQHWIAVVLLAAGVCLWARRNHYLKEWLIRPGMAQTGRLQWEIVEQFRALHPRVEPGSQVVILDDPVAPNDPLNGLETAFIAELWFYDRTVTVYLQRLNHLSPEELASKNHIFGFVQGRLAQIR